MIKSILACIVFAAVVLGSPVGAVALDTVHGREAAGASIDINTASASELEKLPGVGKVTAQKIIAYRKENGRFSSPDDLVKVKGIGPKTMEKVRSRIVVK